MASATKQAAGQRKSSREKVRAYRQRMRALGLRPIQIWVPDTHAPEFAAEAHRQSILVASSPGEAADQSFLESITDPDALHESEH